MNTLGSGYRPWIWPWWKHWLSPSTYYYYLKYKWQRANRGWADCDTWSLDWYLIQWLPDALEYLKKHKHGTPMDMFDGLPVDEHGNPTNESHDAASKRWEEVMDKMIVGFRAKQKQVKDYECELGPYPHVEKMFREGEKWITDEQSAWFDKMRPLEARDEAIFQEGFKLFVEHFESLWD